MLQRQSGAECDAAAYTYVKSEEVDTMKRLRHVNCDKLSCRPIAVIGVISILLVASWASFELLSIYWPSTPGPITKSTSSDLKLTLNDNCTPGWCFASPASFKVQGYWSSFFDVRLDSAMSAFGFHNAEPGESSNLSLHATFGATSLSFWETWSRDAGYVSAYQIVPSSGEPMPCIVNKVSASEHPPDPSLCVPSPDLDLRRAGMERHGTGYYALWSASYPAGVEGSLMPNNSVLNITIDPVPLLQGMRECDGRPQQVVPVWHSLVSPDGKWLIDHVTTDYNRHVPAGAFDLPSACSAEAWRLGMRSPRMSTSDLLARGLHEALIRQPQRRPIRDHRSTCPFARFGAHGLRMGTTDKTEH